MASGGSIENISIKNRLFRVAADADSNRDLGGFTNEIQPNGDGSARKIMTRKPWMLDGLTVEIDNTNQDLEFLQEVADMNDYVAMTITYVDGFSYSGRGTVSGDLQAGSNSATADISLSGPGRLEQQ